MAGGADYEITLAATAKRLSDALPVAVAPLKGGVGGAYDISLRALLLQPDGANNNPIYLSFSPLISTSRYLFRLEKATSTVPPAPFVLEMFGAKFSDLYVIGTAGEVLHFGGWTL